MSKPPAADNDEVKGTPVEPVAAQPTAPTQPETPPEMPSVPKDPSAPTAGGTDANMDSPERPQYPESYAAAPVSGRFLLANAIDKLREEHAEAGGGMNTPLSIAITRACSALKELD